MNSDIDSDGDLDILATIIGTAFSALGLPIYSEGHTLLVNQGGGIFDRHLIQGPITAPNARLVVGDLNDDNMTDVVYSVDGGGWSWRPNIGGSNLGAPQVGVSTGSVTAIACSDFDLDGDCDVVAVVDLNIVVYRNNGSSFASGVVLDTLCSSASSMRDITCTDVTGDGYPDIMVGACEVALYANQQGASFGAKQVVAGSGANLNMGDINGDGLIDAVFVSAGQVVWAPRIQGGGFAPAQSIANVINSWDVELADLDGDGDLDVVVGTYSSQLWQVGLYMNTGAGVFASGGTAGAYPFPIKDIGVSDIDGDTDSDIIVGTSAAQIPGPNGFVGLYENYSVVMAAATPYGYGCTPQSRYGWSQIATANAPSPRSDAASCFDAQRGEWVLFGGFDGAVVGETWVFDGFDWQRRTPTVEPPALRGAQMVYDAARSRAVLFGGLGSAGVVSGSTWEWDGVDWSDVTPPVSPGARQSHAMCYDSARQRTVLFGGNGPAGPGSPYGPLPSWQTGGFYGDTWEYDGTNWIDTGIWGPFWTADAAMVFDSIRGESFLWGGETQGFYQFESWGFDGTIWNYYFYTTPSLRTMNPSMAFDPIRGKVVGFGGAELTAGPTVPSVGAQVAEWDGVEWRTPGWSLAYGAPFPSARYAAAMDWDSVGNRILLFGGQGANFSDETWQLGNTTASSPMGVLEIVPQAPPILGSTATALIENCPLPFGGVNIGFSKTSLNGLPLLPLDLSMIGMPGCQLWQSNDILGVPVSASAPGQMTFAVPVPSSVSLLNEHVYLQAFCVDPGGSLRKIIASNGIDWRFGNQ